MNRPRSLFSDEQNNAAIAITQEIQSGQRNREDAQWFLMNEFSMGRVLSGKLMKLAEQALEQGTAIRRI